MVVKILINKNKCIGCGTCSFLAPKVFKLGKDGKADVVDQSVSMTKEIKMAIEGCPERAISYKE